MENNFKSSFSRPKVFYRIRKIKNTKEIKGKIDKLFSSADNFFKTDAKIIVGKVPRDLSAPKTKNNHKYSMVRSNILAEFVSKSRRTTFRKGNTRQTPKKVGSMTTSSFMRSYNNRTSSLASMENSPETRRFKPIPNEITKIFSGQEKLLKVKSKNNSSRETIEKKLESKVKRRKNDLLMNFNPVSRKNSSSLCLRDSLRDWESSLRGLNQKKIIKLRKQKDYNKTQYSHFNTEKQEEMHIKTDLSIRGVSIKPVSPRIYLPENTKREEEVFKESFN